MSAITVTFLLASSLAHSAALAVTIWKPIPGKAVAMFDKLNVPVFGVIENMSYFVCPHCDERTEIFGHGGGRKAAEELGLEFLGEIPLDLKTRVGADTGVPIVESDPDSLQGQAFMRVAEQVAARCSTLQFATAGVE